MSDWDGGANVASANVACARAAARGNPPFPRACGLMKASGARRYAPIREDGVKGAFDVSALGPSARRPRPRHAAEFLTLTRRGGRGRGSAKTLAVSGSAAFYSVYTAIAPVRTSSARGWENPEKYWRGGEEVGPTRNPEFSNHQ